LIQLGIVKAPKKPLTLTIHSKKTMVGLYGGNKEGVENQSSFSKVDVFFKI